MMTLNPDPEGPRDLFIHAVVTVLVLVVLVLVVVELAG